MRSRIQDGAGTTVKAGVFDHRMREFEVQQSLANHISTSVLNGRTGTFTATSFLNLTGQNNGNYNILSITNIDPNNFLVVDKAYVQIASFNLTLPNSTIKIGLSRNYVTVAPNRVLINENRFRSISTTISAIVPGSNPNVIISSGTGAGNAAAIEIMTTFATLGDIIDLIPQGVDSIILPAGKIPANNTSNNNTVAITLNTAFQAITAQIFGFIRFMMVPPEDMG